ncbi:MAG TPA: hypothetical protein VFA67_16485 [Candidatus Sulfotelmatobacter sp.]|nr:hypothetical protein [Candidatus Sulfotelmatobacter sp.]
MNATIHFRGCILFALALSLLGFTGCNKSPRPVNAGSRSGSGSSSNPLERQFDGGTYCVTPLTQGPPPPQPLHFSNKRSESDGSAKDFEADLSGDTLDVTISDRHPATDMDRDLAKLPGTIPIVIRDGFAESSHTNHYSRSDASGWRIGGNGIALGGTPWGLFVSKPLVTAVGPEQVSGYDTIKYAVDTTHQTPLDKAALLMAGQLKDYNITGNAWVLKDANCVLQYDINFEEDGKDGSVKKTHYEGTVAKK